MIRFVGLLALSLVLVSFGTKHSAAEEAVTGLATRIRDIDTLEIDGIPIRLNGLDGPELSEPRGQEAKAWLIALLSDVELSCTLSGERTYDRYVGTCYLPDGRDLSAVIIQNGYGRDCRRYSGGKYAEFETALSRSLVSHGYCR